MRYVQLKATGKTGENKILRNKNSAGASCPGKFLHNAMSAREEKSAHAKIVLLIIPAGYNMC